MHNYLHGKETVKDGMTHEDICNALMYRASLWPSMTAALAISASAKFPNPVTIQSNNSTVTAPSSGTRTAVIAAMKEYQVTGGRTVNTNMHLSAPSKRIQDWFDAKRSYGAFTLTDRLHKAGRTHNVLGQLNDATSHELEELQYLINLDQYHPDLLKRLTQHMDLQTGKDKHETIREVLSKWFACSEENHPSPDELLQLFIGRQTNLTNNMKNEKSELIDRFFTVSSTSNITFDELQRRMSLPHDPIQLSGVLQTLKDRYDSDASGGILIVYILFGILILKKMRRWNNNLYISFQDVERLRRKLHEVALVVLKGNCVICHCDIKSDSCAQLDCGHRYHMQCIEDLERHAKYERTQCPLCRKYSGYIHTCISPKTAAKNAYEALTLFKQRHDARGTIHWGDRVPALESYQAIMDLLRRTPRVFTPATDVTYKLPNLLLKNIKYLDDYAQGTTDTFTVNLPEENFKSLLQYAILIYDLYRLHDTKTNPPSSL